ncbi:FtsL-like putative cell division protein [Hymenobacter sp. DG25A]|uniref:FtsL-like putative cell division protein n=1 Tax=Hymenobacter sp. DG25A TaxID=1385663 RepID=UPI0008FF9D8E|nr:FtsL-like putative cell division protein [Hymenobacter sp. DG25A]
MAINTLRPLSSQPRANVPREVAPPAPAPEPPREPAREKPERPRPTRQRSTWSVFSLLDRLASMDGLFREGLPVRFLPHLLFIMFLTLVYIGNTHYGLRMNRSIQKLKLETEDLRADYTTLKSDYMEASKQSEVARKVAAYGLVESSSPPFRITVPAGRLDAAELDTKPLLTADSVAAQAVADSAARANPPAAEDEPVDVGAPPVPVGVPTTEATEAALHQSEAETATKPSSNRSATRRNERKR